MVNILKNIISVICIILFVVLFFYVSIFVGRIFGIENVLLAPSHFDRQVCFKGNCFSVEIARTEAEKEKGLMFRKELDKKSGMLFIFDKDGIYPFWMKNTIIPLDIIGINENYEVVFINKSVQPCTELTCPIIKPSAMAKYVLEVNSGVSERIGLNLGDKLQLKIN
jgi:uncharacterized membrane protein (UPF0127 family)